MEPKLKQLLIDPSDRVNFSIYNLYLDKAKLVLFIARIPFNCKFILPS